METNLEDYFVHVKHILLFPNGIGTKCPIISFITCDHGMKDDKTKCL